MTPSTLTFLLLGFLGSRPLFAQIVPVPDPGQRPSVFHQQSPSAPSTPFNEAASQLRKKSEAAVKEFGAVVSHEIMDEKFSVPTDEFHATSEAFGSRLLTGTQEGSLAAFSIERRGDSYQVVRLGKQALAWELSKIVLAWGLVAFVLFAALFGVAEKFRRQKRSSIRK